MSDKRLLDLSVSDVHAPSSLDHYAGGYHVAPLPAVPEQQAKWVMPDPLLQPAAIAIVHDRKGRVLAVSRPEEPYEMSIPGGHVEPGESPEQAAVRELLEETGVIATSTRHVRDVFSPDDGRQLHVFAVDAWNVGRAIGPWAREPNTKVAWMSPDDLFAQAQMFHATLRSLMVAGELHRAGATMTEPTQTDLSISAEKRESIPEREFALPAQRKYPLDTAARTRNAASRLEQMKKRGKVSSGDYASARSRIAKAAKKFGIESQYNESDKGSGPVSRAFHIRADIAHGGELHVRHMSDRVFYDGEGVELTDAVKSADGPIWIQVAKQGSFAGHPAGPFELTQRTFGEIIANFKSTVNRAIPIDYEHASEQDPTSGTIPTSGAPAQGWIRDLKVDGGNLWGLVEWLPQARDQIRGGHYKFLSPAIRFGSKDRVSGRPIGARLTSAAMTNEPFLDGLQPLAAKDAASALAREQSGRALLADKPGALSSLVHSTHETMPKIRAALRLHETASATECDDHLGRVREMCMSAGPTGVHQGVNLADYTDALREIAGATPGMTWDDVFGRVQDMIDSAMDEHVEEYHAGQASMRDAGSTETMAQTETEMTTATTTAIDKDSAALALKDAQTKAGEMATKVGEMTVQLSEATQRSTTLEHENATLTLKFKDVDSKREAAEGALAKATELRVLCGIKTKDGSDASWPEVFVAAATELKTLRDSVVKRESDEIAADVEAAFDTYKDERHLSDKDKAHMLTVRKATPEAFTGMFPKIDPSKRHLMKVLVQPEARPTAAQAEGESLDSRARKIVTDSKGAVSYTNALLQAASGV